jgi:hypothetical protein
MRALSERSKSKGPFDLSLLESALTRTISHNSFRFRSYKNMGGGGYPFSIEESYDSEIQ